MHLSELKQVFTAQEVTQTLPDASSAVFAFLALAFIKNKIGA